MTTRAAIVTALLFVLSSAAARAEEPDATPTPGAEATPAAQATPQPEPQADPPEPPPAAAPASTAAPAASRPEPTRRRRIESPKWFSAELGGGALQLQGDVARAVYGDGYEPTFHSRIGVLFFSMLDLGVSADATQITARRLGANDGTRSAELTRLTLLPLSATALIRLDLFRNQPIVPYAGAGYSYLVWSERNPIEDEQVDGDKQGVTLLGGVQILLDWMEPSRAQDLDAWWGVNDTYLTLELSRTTYGDGDDVTGLDLGHLEARAAFLFEF